MVDTIILLIIIPRSAIINSTKFAPVFKGGYRRLVSNPTKDDKKKWGYLPRLTITFRDDLIYLKVEFSAPKIIFKDNINEIQESDFEPTVCRMVMVIEALGIKLDNEQIKKAKVITFHPAKNIILKNFYDPAFVIKELEKVNISRKFDIDRKELRNGGTILQFYTNLHALCFYDKKRDLDKPAKRAFDKDQTAKQLSLFQTLSDKKIEILRMEARLNDKKIKYILEKIGYQNYEPFFEDIFKKDLCQKILQYYWQYIFDDNMFLFDTRNSPQNILNMVLDKYSDKRVNLYKLFGLVGLVLCSKDEIGMIGIRNIVEFYKPKTNWSKIMAWLDEFKKDLDKVYLHGFIKDIEDQLDKFEPLRAEINQ